MKQSALTLLGIACSLYSAAAFSSPLQLYCQTQDPSLGYTFQIDDIEWTHTAKVTEKFQDRVLGPELYLYSKDGTEKDEVDYVGQDFTLAVYIDWTTDKFPAIFTGIVSAQPLNHLGFTCQYLDPTAVPPHDHGH
jgi:hypothetical protein